MNNLITLHIRQTADLLATYRVSQDGGSAPLPTCTTSQPHCSRARSWPTCPLT